MISCPWCGCREETEFQHGGEAHIKRPEKPETLSDASWAEYLFMETNNKGIYLERWAHRYGCRRWFNVARNTITNEILAIYKIGENPPSKVR